MTRPHKGDRVRLTLRLPRELVEEVDDFRHRGDRNEALRFLVELGLRYLREGHGR